MSPESLFTIGHTTHSFDAFAEMLLQYGVTAVADVRSHPYSSRLPQFNRETLAAGLKALGVRYVFLGEELGARRVEPECYEGDRVVYERIARLAKFRSGMERLRQGAREYQIALMCAEKEPLDCHRTILICRELRREFRILHILANGTAEDHAQTEKRLIGQMDISRTLFEPDLSDEQLIQKAYERRAEQIAYRASADQHRWRARFQDAAGNEYCLKITDAKTTRRLEAGNKISNQSLLTISLTKPWAPSDGSQPERCYKLVAAVIEL
jgi:hypothetical protein